MAGIRWFWRGRWRRRLTLFVLLVAALAFARALSKPAVRDGAYLLVDVGGEYLEAPPGGGLGRWLGRRPPALLELLTLLRDAREDRRIAGMVVCIRPLAVGWAKAQEIRDGLAAFRRANKALIALLEHELSNSTREYYVASAAPTIYLLPGSSAPLSGLLAQYTFLGGLWEKLDVEMAVEQTGEYKTMGDLLGRKQMSAAHREMANWLLDSLFAQFVTAVAAGRDLDPARVRAAVDRAPIAAAEFVALGLADGTTFVDDLRARLLGADGEFLSVDDYRAAGGAGITPTADGKIAAVFGTGTIHTGEDWDGAWSGDTMGADTFAEAFREAADDDDVRAIVFRIDSPGGSALASDLIWHATQYARRKKPVIVSMSDVAGSGGYYVAAGADRILASAGTITGSIGVVVSKPNVAGLLANLGVHTETLTRGAHARLGSATDPLGAAERERIVTAMNEIYRVFVRRVAEGRRLGADDVDRIARGRVWTGEQAHARGLVDELGGFLAAIDAAKAAAGLPRGERVELAFYPQPRGWFARFVDLVLLRAGVRLPPWLARLPRTVPALEFPDGALLALMPQAIEIR